MIPVDQRLITVIIASYNKENLIAETIRSVIDQSYTSWEMIIVDDLSTDNSAAVIRSFRDPRIRFVANDSNKGANFCRNLGLSMAQGEYLVFLDADDLLSFTCLQERVHAADAFPAANLLVFSMGVFYSKAGDANQTWTPTSREPLKDFLKHDLPWSIMQPLWKKELLQQLGGFDESFQRLQDVELNTRALLQPGLVYQLFPHPPDCYYRIDEARKNFDTNTFLTRWVDSALHYCNKMSRIIPQHLKACLLGTFFQTYFQVLYHYRLKQISLQEFESLEQKLLTHPMITKLGALRKMIFKISKSYNLYGFRIPGFNRFLKILLTA